MVCYVTGCVVCCVTGCVVCCVCGVLCDCVCGVLCCVTGCVVCCGRYFNDSGSSDEGGEGEEAVRERIAREFRWGEAARESREEEEEEEEEDDPLDAFMAGIEVSALPPSLRLSPSFLPTHLLLLLSLCRVRLRNRRLRKWLLPS